MFELIDRWACKQKAAEAVRNASVSARMMTALYMALLLVMNLFSNVAGGGVIGSFVTIFTGLLSSVLAAGFCLYCMAIRRGERAEYLTIFDGFSFVGKIVLLEIVSTVLIVFWTMLFLIPGLIAAYRYSFAVFNLYENPGVSVMEALEMSKRQTLGYKSQLFMLDLSYLGWELLALLPTILVSFLASSSAMQNFSVDAYQTAMLDPVAYLGIPFWLWTVGEGLWTLLVSLFYYPHYLCVKLEYFEIAKSTSGVGWNPAPRPGGWDDSWGGQGPNDFDGF